jgi:hypothetical protein
VVMKLGWGFARPLFSNASWMMRGDKYLEIQSSLCARQALCTMVCSAPKSGITSRKR